MLYNLIASTDSGETILEWIDAAALAIEILAVVIIVAAIFYATGRYLLHAVVRPEEGDHYQDLKIRPGNAR